MSRKTATIKITSPGRDTGKTFVLTEMPAARAEAWATRFLLALAASGVQLPENILEAGMAGVAYVGVRALGGLKWPEAKELMDEMMECISIMPDPKNPAFTRPLVNMGSDGDDIEEVTTRVRLRDEVVALHTGFSVAAYLSTLRSSAMTQAASTGPNAETSQGASLQ